MNSSLTFNREMNVSYGVLTDILTGVRRLVAENPSPFTFKGTNTYVIGKGAVAVIDPGPDDAVHAKTLLSALAGERITDIVLTHGHHDHLDGMIRLRTETGARTWGFGPISAGSKSETPDRDGTGSAGHAFIPDHILSDRDRVAGEGWSLEAIHTPGHAPDHLCFALKIDQREPASPDSAPILFSGDHVMGWSTTVVAPPEGHMGDYIRSLEKLLGRDETLYLPGHGGRIKEAKRVVKAYLVHRKWREASIKQCLKNGQITIDQILETLYREIDEALKHAAALSVFAHLEYLIERGEVSARQPAPASLTSTFSLL